ncbi:transposase [uncultured Psychrobacter sp.]|uniref:transposase n=1 Tax=uncultured Psychrobacter sp. TaxID=259303 RepID=UPI00259A959C|nr:transposase [uncultured Psychrobacter sp.]
MSLVVDHKRKIPDVVDSLGIGKSTLQKWLSQYRQEMSGQAPKVGNALTDEQRELQELREQVKRLTMERDILKKASALLALDSLNGYR